MSAIPEQNLSYLTLFSADDSPTANVVVANYPTSHLNLNLRCTVTVETVQRKGILSKLWLKSLNFSGAFVPH